MSQEVPTGAAGDRGELRDAARPRLWIERAREKGPQGRRPFVRQPDRFAVAAFGFDEAWPVLVEVKRRKPGIGGGAGLVTGGNRQ